MVKRGGIHKNNYLPEKHTGRKLVIIILILIALLIVALYSYYPINCKADEACFIKEAQVCSRASVSTYKEGNEFIYEIKAQKGADCIFSIKMNKMREGTDYNLVKLMEGREMLCQIPLEEFKKNPLADTKDVIDRCTGSLKEALQQLTIERLYSVIIGNIAGIDKELQKLVS